MNAQILQLAISLGGIALMVGLCLFLFGAKVAALSTDAVAACLARDVPGFRAGKVALSRDGTAALVEDARDGTVYLALARGDGVVTRRLMRGTALRCDGEELELLLNEFTLKRARLELADAGDWAARLA
jgi:hypothetical protein